MDQVPQIAAEKADTVPRVNGKKSGWGEYTYMNGNRYEGSYVDDEMNGQGVYYFASGDRYEGSFKDDNFHG